MFLVTLFYFTDNRLYEQTAHETVLVKEQLADRFRCHLWKESTHLSVPGEDLLIANLLMDDEKETLHSDKQLEIEDIGQFGAYTCYTHIYFISYYVYRPSLI